MIKTSLSTVQGTTVQVRLCEADDRGLVLVNDHHFALVVGQSLDVSSALRTGINTLQFVVDNTGVAIPLMGNLPGGPWSGRFELYIAGGLKGAYADKGNDGPLSKQHIIAEVELLVTLPAPDIEKPTEDKGGIFGIGILRL